MGELATGGNALLFLPYNAKWRNQRKIYHSALMEKRADDYRPIQEWEAKRLCWDVRRRRCVSRERLADSLHRSSYTTKKVSAGRSTSSALLLVQSWRSPTAAASTTSKWASFKA